MNYLIDTHILLWWIFDDPKAGTLPIAHRDPFDQMLMAQAQLEQMPIVTHDRAFRQDFLTTISP